MDTPFIGGREFPGKAFLDKELDGMFAQAAGGEGPHGRSLSLDLDVDIVNGLLGHPEVGGLLLLVAASWGLESVVRGCRFPKSPMTVAQ